MCRMFMCVFVWRKRWVRTPDRDTPNAIPRARVPDETRRLVEPSCQLAAEFASALQGHRCFRTLRRSDVSDPPFPDTRGTPAAAGISGGSITRLRYSRAARRPRSLDALQWLRRVLIIASSGAVGRPPKRFGDQTTLTAITRTGNATGAFWD